MLEGVEELLERLDEDKHVVIHDDHRKIHVLTRTGSGHGWQHEVIEKVPGPASHCFESLEGFISYLNSDRCAPDRGIIFVGAQSVVARLRYQSVESDRAVLTLAPSEEFMALQQLMNGVPHKHLWRLLNTHLFGCIDLRLLMQISQISISGKNDGQVKISDVGQVESKGEQSLRVEWSDGKAETGGRRQDIGKEWEFEGRIWGAYSRKFKIKLVLEIDAEKVCFIFHAQRLETVMRDARQELVKELTAGLLPAGESPARFTVHEGFY